MDKKSEQSKDHKAKGDIDVGVHDYGAGGKRQQLDGLWGTVSEEVVDQPKSRIATNDYKKPKSGEKREEVSILDEVIEHGPPLLNISKPNRVF